MNWGELWAKVKKLPQGLFLIPIILLGVHIRIQNLTLLQDKLLLGLDPYFFLRVSKTILEQGTFPAIDTLRYMPLGLEANTTLMGLSYVNVWIYKLFSFTGITIEQVHIFYPVIFFAIGLLFFYLLTKELFNTTTALIASLLLAIIPPYVFRTIAGFADKEALAMALFFAIFYTYVKAIKSKHIAWAIASGILTGLMGFVWGGVKFAMVIITLFNLILFFLGRFDKQQLFIYISWVIPFTLMLGFLTARYGGIKGLLTSTTSMVAYGVIILYLANRVVRKTPIKKIPLPNQVTTFLSLGILGVLTAFLFLGQEFILGIITDIVDSLIFGLTSGRLGATVAENRQPYLSNWITGFQFVFVLLLAGAIALFHSLIKNKWVTTGFGSAIIIYILTRISPSSAFNGTNLLSKGVMIGTLVIAIIAAAVLYIYTFHKKKEIYEHLKQVSPTALFALTWFVFMIIASRGAIRMIFVFVPIGVIMAAYAIDYAQKKAATKKVAILIILALLLLPQIYSFSVQSYTQASLTRSDINDQWLAAADWIQTTAYDSVFVHWWDYGYWIQTLGNRATVTDGGNFIQYWNHLVGRHVLSAESEQEALEFMYAHDVTHLFIVSDEIQKYTAYSSIGSDEEFDIFSWVSTFVMSPTTSKKDDVTTYFFTGGHPLDDDIVFEGKLLPKNQAYLAYIEVPIKGDDTNNYTIQQPIGVIAYNGQQERVPLGCMYIDGEWNYYNGSLGGCVRIMPRYLAGGYQQANGALLYVSEKGRKALWTKLFLFDEPSPHFKLRYDDSNQNPLVYANGVFGPIKIWQVQYPENFTISDEVREKYLAKTTPEWEALDKINVWREELP